KRLGVFSAGNKEELAGAPSAVGTSLQLVQQSKLQTCSHKCTGRVLRGVVGPEPLDDFDAVAVGIVDEETIRPGNRRRLLGGQAVLLEIAARLLGVGHAQGEMARAERVGFVLEQQVQVLVAQVKPHHHKIEGARLVDLLQAQQVAVEPPAAL